VGLPTKHARHAFKPWRDRRNDRTELTGCPAYAAISRQITGQEFAGDRSAPLVHTFGMSLLSFRSARTLRTSAPLAFLLAAAPAWAAEYYVAPDGDDGNAGTQAAPFKSVGKGQQVAAAGDTVWVHGGTYAITTGTVGVAFSKAGQAGSPIRYFAYPGEVPVFDLSAINPTGRVTGFDVHTSYVHIRGMEITGVPQYQSGQDSWGLRIQGNNNVIEQMNVHHNEAPGIFITSGAGNLILNCDSHHNYDVLEDGGSGDGFGCHSTGSGNVLRGCRAWSNSDDGYDFINAPGTCTAEQSWAWRNGWVPDTNTGAGNGAGFKAGGFGLDSSTFPAQPPIHVVQQCVAWSNRSQGFYANHHPGTLHFYNNTAYNNPKNFDLLDDVGAATHVLRNNVVFGSGTTVANGTSDDVESNSWNGGITVAEEDFLSLEDTEAAGPRGADGSLPNLSFLHLAEDSDCVDAGEDVGLPFAGNAPDLGAFETGLSVAPSGSASMPMPSSSAPPSATPASTSSSPPAPSNPPSAEMPVPATASAGPMSSGPGAEPSAALSAAPSSQSSVTAPTSMASNSAPSMSSSTTSSSSAAPSGAASNAAVPSDTGNAASEAGCGCTIGGASPPRPLGALLLAGLALAWQRRRTRSAR
jgi:MYXO-CTERM domain-containing protein